MVEITINKFKDVDIRTIANFIFDIRQTSVFQNTSRTVEGIESTLQELVADENQIVIITSSGGKIAGILRIYVGFQEMVFTDNWHPIVTPGEEEDTIATELIQTCKQYIKEQGFSRLEVLLSPLSDRYSEAHLQYKSWYESVGFHKATEETLMRVNLENLLLPDTQPSLPKGLRLESIDNVENKDIENPFFESFRGGRDRLFLDMTEAQQRVSFNYWFSRQRPLHMASTIVMKDGNVVGFNVVRPDDESVEIGPVGVIPRYKRQGIMKAVLHESIKRLQEDGVKTAQLEADTRNEPAINLYKMFGFEQVHTQEYYAWKVE
ncbi:MAG: GNAT family N-acetyltransferase [Candidatus Thorarchaeota archaeon]